MSIMRKTIAGLVLVIVPSITGLASAPAAQATTNHVRLTTADNKPGFHGKRHDSAFVIRVTARHPSGARMPGKARLYVNGHHLRTRDLHRGSIRFDVPRSRLPNNREATVKVRIMPWNPNIRDRIVKRHVTDRPETRGASGVVTVAKHQIGERYVFGAAGPNAFDCSGLVQYSYRHATGERLPHSSGAIRRAGDRVSRPKPGDVVWTRGHVSIYAGHGKVVEAASPGTRVRLIKRWQKNPVYLRF